MAALGPGPGPASRALTGHPSLVLDFTSLVLTYFVLGSLGTAARTHGEHGELQCPHTTMVTPQQWQSVTGVTRVMIAGCQVATGQGAGCRVLGAGCWVLGEADSQLL